MKSMDIWLRHISIGFAAGLSLLLGSCGGGEQKVPFNPARYIAFGDEMSVLETPEGRKYTVNGLASDGSINCVADGSGLWIQGISNIFGMVFEECNPTKAVPAAFTFAAAGAKADDFLKQVAEAKERFGPFTCNDLMSVLIGTNDVIDLFENVYLADPTPDTANTVTNELSARGARLGKAIAALTANDGTQIIVSTIPLVNLTPYALRWNVERPGLNILNVLNNFSSAFNTALRVNIPNDGSRWALVELDALLQAASNNPGGNGLVNITNAICEPATWGTTACTTNTLVTTDNVNSWLWASDKWIGWQAHNRLGTFARNRATGNPFGCS